MPDAASAAATPAGPSPAAGPGREPVMGVTGYDRASAAVIAVVLALVVAVAYLFVEWLSQHEFEADTLPPLETVVIGGGDPDGNPDDSPLLESLAEQVPDPSLEELREDETTVEELLETVVDVSDRAADPAPNATAGEAGGTPGSAAGNGGRPLGFGPGDGGVSAEQRWFVSFADRGSLEEYGRQLDHFGIELGVLDVQSGSLTLVRDFSKPQPTVTRKTSGADDGRLYFLWQAGGRKAADEKLLAKAGVDAVDKPVLHFYPQKTEQRLLRLEKDHANRDFADIRRTYFEVVNQGRGYDFSVTQQSYLR